MSTEHTHRTEHTHTERNTHTHTEDTTHTQRRSHTEKISHKKDKQSRSHTHTHTVCPQWWLACELKPGFRPRTRSQNTGPDDAHVRRDRDIDDCFFGDGCWRPLCPYRHRGAGPASKWAKQGVVNSTHTALSPHHQRVDKPCPDDNMGQEERA